MPYTRHDAEGAIPNAITDLGLQPGQTVTLTFVVGYPGSGTTDLLVPGRKEVVQVPNRVLAKALEDAQGES